jgi:hypothetical protein
MTNEQINAAIAEACGWDHKPINCGGANYCTDLNAMHEAEKYLDTDELFRGYYLALYDVTQSTRWPIHATARQRAEAFLRTLGKWEEGE